MFEIDLIIGLVMIILYGLYSLRSKLVYIADVTLFARIWPILILIGILIDGVDVYSDQWYAGSAISMVTMPLSANLGIDLLLCILTVLIMYSFKSSFESTLLLMLAFVGQIGLLHSCDLVSFFICLELGNFVFLVLVGLQPDSHGSTSNQKTNNKNINRMYGGFSVESALKFALLSAFSSGVLLFWFSHLYLRTGSSFLFFKYASVDFNSQLEAFQILLALMFKLGAAPLHLWVVDIYGSVKRSLLLYISTAPKLSLFGFWVGSWHGVWTDYSIALFAIFSLILGSFGAYGQPALRALFAYSTINEIGVLLLALETAGFHTLFQHLVIYMLTQVILWNLSDKRLFSLIVVSLAGLPPLLGFFGKAWIFGHVASTGLTAVLLIALFTTGVSLVYYIRVIRLFYNKSNATTVNSVDRGLVGVERTVGISCSSLCYDLDQSASLVVSRVNLTSAAVVFLIFGPVFFIKPFVL
jgi:NADH:ubiquinone oxidoreductase subunit 2 (subunit N)